MGPSTSLPITSEKPRMAFSGVLSSWLMDARKRDLARLASSARKRASSDIDFAVSNSAISASFSVRKDRNIKDEVLMRADRYEKKGRASTSSAAMVASTGRDR